MNPIARISWLCSNEFLISSKESHLTKRCRGFIRSGMLSVFCCRHHLLSPIIGVMFTLTKREGKEKNQKDQRGALDVFNSQCLRRICGNRTVMHKQKANLVQYLKLVPCKCSLRLLRIYVDKTYKVPECWKLHFWAP